MTVVQTSLPNRGPGKLQMREDPNQRASNKPEHLQPATDFYKQLSLEAAGQQIAIDMFLLNQQYADHATLGESSFPPPSLSPLSLSFSLLISSSVVWSSFSPFTLFNFHHLLLLLYYNFNYFIIRWRCKAFRRMHIFIPRSAQHAQPCGS